MIIEGAISVKSAITNHKRKINKLYIDSKKKTKDFNYIRKIARDNNIEILETSSEELSKLASGKTFGGVLLDAEERINEELIEGDVFYLDGIEDPFNLGYIMRTLFAFGINNLILPSRDYKNMEVQLLKSSAGAYDMMNVKVSEDALKDIQELKSKGYTCYALQRSDNSKDIFDVRFNKPAVFMIGGEKRGIASSLLQEADEDLYISYGSSFRNALNAASAATTVATLLYSQRRHD